MTKIEKILKPNLEDRTDEELMRLFIHTKKPEPFGIIYRRHFISLSKYLKWLIGDIEQAKDIAQNIFIKVHDKPSLFNTSENFKVWLLTIAKNQWKNTLRNQSSRKNSLKEFSADIQQVNEEKQKDDSRKLILKKVMGELTETHKEVIVLKYSSNLKINEIATFLECSEGTVKSRLFYALNNLKDLIKKEES